MSDTTITVFSYSLGNIGNSLSYESRFIFDMSIGPFASIGFYSVFSGVGTASLTFSGDKGTS